MSKDFEYIFFDFDGTLADTFLGVTSSFAYALNHYGVKVKSLSDLRFVLGPPLKDSFINHFNFSDKTADEAVAKFRERYNEYFVKETILYPGVNDLIKGLYDKGYKLVIATSKPEKFVKTLLKHFELYDYFCFVSSATMDEKRNSKPDIIKYAISSLDIKDISKVVMVGDRKFDLVSANEFSMYPIGVLYGYGSYEELSQCPNNYLANDAKDLYNYIIN